MSISMGDGFDNLKYPGTNPGAMVLERLKTRRAFVFVPVGVWLLWAVFIIIRLVRGGNTGFEVAALGVVAIIFIPSAIIFFAYAGLLKTARIGYLKDFAVINNFIFTEKASVDGFADGEIFQIGEMRKVRNIIKGRLGIVGFVFCTCSYQFNTGRGARQHSVSVLKLEFGTLLPEMVLEPKKFYFGASLAHGLEKIQAGSSLEAKFNLWVKQEYEIEALQVLSESRNATISQYYNFALEFVGSSIFLYFPEGINSTEQMQRIFAYADYLINEVGPTLQGMRSGLAAMNDQFTPKVA